MTRDWSREREAMVLDLAAGNRIGDPRILAAMLRVRRHAFIPEACRDKSDPYGDHPCSIGHDQTISQPYIVAYMTERLNPRQGEKVLEIGAGSGYQAAVLAELGARVYTVEIIPELAAHARRTLAEEGYGEVEVLTGDGYAGWPAYAPFDAIAVTCAPEAIPPALVEQLADNGRMILPVGAWSQRLVVLRNRNGKTGIEDDLPVRFVPMVHGKD